MERSIESDYLERSFQLQWRAKCQTHSQMNVNSFSTDPNIQDLFKCYMCIQEQPKLVNQILDFDYIASINKEMIIRNLCCKDMQIFKDVEKVLNVDDQKYLDQIRQMYKNMQATILNTLETWYNDCVAQYQQFTTERSVKLEEYNIISNKEQLKKMVVSSSLNREQREQQIRQFNYRMQDSEIQNNISKILQSFIDLGQQNETRRKKLEENLIQGLQTMIEGEFSLKNIILCNSISTQLQQQIIKDISTQQFTISSLSNLSNQTQKIATDSQNPVQSKINDNGIIQPQTKKISILAHSHTPCQTDLIEEEQQQFPSEENMVKFYEKVEILQQMMNDLKYGEYVGDISGNQRNGFGAVKQEAFQYFGEWKEGQKQGFGLWIWPNGTKHEGYFEDGIISGIGRRKQQNGNMYEGMYKFGKQHGKGKHTQLDGAYYEGDFKNNEFQGYGVMVRPNGTKYIGNFLFGEYHGLGELQYPNGDKYIGNFLFSKFHGKGIFFEKGEILHDGYWIDNDFAGQNDLSVTY